MARLGWIVVALPVVAGCGGSTVGRDESVVRRDSAGVQIVENRQPLARLPAWRVDSVPLVSAQDGAGSPGALVGISVVRQVAGGNIVAVDTRAADLKVFDSTGRFVRTIGRRGQGPDEFQMPWTLSPFSADTSYVLDLGLGRATLLRGAEPVGTVPLPRPNRSMPSQTLGLQSRDTAIVSFYRGSQPQQEGVAYQNPVPFVRATVAGTVIDTVAIGKGAELYTIATTEGGHSMIGGESVGMGNETKFQLAGRRLYLGDTETAEFSVVGLGTRARRIVRWRATDQPITDADKRDLFRFDSTNLATAAGGDLGMRAAMFASMRSKRFAARMPFFTDLVIADDGAVWLEQYQRPWTFVRRYLVADSTGALIATVTLPPRVRPYQVTGDRIIARWRDGDDVDHVRVYRVVKPVN